MQKGEGNSVNMKNKHYLCTRNEKGSCFIDDVAALDLGCQGAGGAEVDR